MDVEPRGCPVERTYGFRTPLVCPSHACSQQHCEPEAFSGTDGHPTEPTGLTLVTDERGCPRCRSYTASPLRQEVARRIQSLGIGCGFEQHFEALRLSLFGLNPENEGFSRPDSLVSVLFFMNEDDCSVHDPIIFSPADGTTLFDFLGPMNSFRCTRFGIVCDEPWPDRFSPAGTYPMTNCRPRPSRDSLNFLHPISRYEPAFGALRDAGRLQLSAISGSYTSSLTVNLTPAGGWPYLNHDCGIGEAADPAVRLPAFLGAMDPGHFEYGAWTSFCHQNYDQVLNSMSGRIRIHMEGSACLRHAVARDPLPAPAPEGILLFAPFCRVVEVNGDTRTPVPLCDPFYRDGHPPHLDPGLPQPVCYHLDRDLYCPRNIVVEDTRDAPRGDVLPLAPHPRIAWRACGICLSSPVPS